MEIPTGFALAAIVLTSTGDPDDMVNTWGVALTSDATLSADLDAMMEAYTDAWAPDVSSIIERTRYVLYQSPADGGDIVDVIPTGAAFGTSAGNVVPNNSSYVMRKTCGVGGRKHRGRCFVPGVLVGNLTDQGEVSETQRTEIAGRLETFLEAFPFGGIEKFVLLHTDPLVPPDDVLQLTCAAKLGTTKHRYRN